MEMTGESFRNMTEMFCYAFFLEILRGKKSVWEKVKTARKRDYKDFFQFSSYSASVIEIVHHTQISYAFSSYSPDCPDTKTVKVQPQYKNLCDGSWHLMKTQR